MCAFNIFTAGIISTPAAWVRTIRKIEKNQPKKNALEFWAAERGMAIMWNLDGERMNCMLPIGAFL